MGDDRITPVDLPEPRYEYGGDDHVFVELAEAMSFTANFKAMAITQQVAEREIDGVVENCPANASYMLRIDPDVAHPDTIIEELREIEAALDVENYEWETRVIDVPVLFEDPWTHETLMEFRDRHQDPDGTDLEYSAELNGFDSVEAFIDAFVAAPHMVTMVGFVPGCRGVSRWSPGETTRGSEVRRTTDRHTEPCNRIRRRVLGHLSGPGCGRLPAVRTDADRGPRRRSAPAGFRRFDRLPQSR